MKVDTTKSSRMGSMAVMAGVVLVLIALFLATGASRVFAQDLTPTDPTPGGVKATATTVVGVASDTVVSTGTAMTTGTAATTGTAMSTGTVLPVTTGTTMPMTTETAMPMASMTMMPMASATMMPMSSPAMMPTMSTGTGGTGGTTGGTPNLPTTGQAQDNSLAFTLVGLAGLALIATGLFFNVQRKHSSKR